MNGAQEVVVWLAGFATIITISLLIFAYNMSRPDDEDES